MKRFGLGLAAVVVLVGGGLGGWYYARNQIPPVTMQAHLLTVWKGGVPAAVDYQVKSGEVTGVQVKGPGGVAIKSWAQQQVTFAGKWDWQSTYWLLVKMEGGIPRRQEVYRYPIHIGPQPLPVVAETITINPTTGEQVGMATTWQISFQPAIPQADWTAVINKLMVTNSIPVTVGWHWWSGTELDGRPQSFWPLNETAAVTVNLNGISGAGVQLKGEASSSFTVNEQHLTKISEQTDQMQVYNGGQLINTFPVSLGKAGFRTISGTLTVLYKEPVVFMNSATIGYPGLYAENVYLDVAISSDGYYIHSAPWDVYDHGKYNVSFGCVEENPGNAQWFYNWSEPGDAVIISGTGLNASENDGEGDWNLPWSSWQVS